MNYKVYYLSASMLFSCNFLMSTEVKINVNAIKFKQEYEANCVTISMLEFAIKNNYVDRNNIPSITRLNNAKQAFANSLFNYISWEIRLGYMGGGLIFAMFIIDYLNWRTHDYSFKNLTIITPYGASGIFILSSIVNAWLLDNINKKWNNFSHAEKAHNAAALKKFKLTYTE